MAARAPLKYRIVLRGRKGFSQLRYATTFEIWYGRRKVVSATPFSARHKKVVQRKTYLQNLVKRIEKVRLTILADRRKKRTKKKLTEELQVAKKRQQRAISSPRAKLTPTQKHFVVMGSKLESARPQFENTVQIEPIQARRATIVDTLLIPVVPKGEDYSKQIIDKIITPVAGGRYHVAIMDLNLNHDKFIMMDTDNFLEAYHQAGMAFLPHLFHYFERTKRSSRKYILRIKFLHKWDRAGAFEDHAISWLRTELTTDDGLMQLFRKTFEQMFAGDEFGPTTKLLRRTNYLAGDGHIFITGVSFEAANSD